MSVPRYQTVPGILASKVEEEIILMSMEDDAYITLNPVASRIWELLESPRTLEELVALLMEEFEVGEEDCQRDVRDFLEDMSNRRLIREVEAV